jgi:transposase-like protein
MGRSIETQNNQPYTPFHERTLSGEQKRKLVDLITEGIEVMRETEAMTKGLNDTVSSIAKELDIKPSILKKAIKVAQKGRFTETNEDFLDLEHVLQNVGKTDL